MLIILFNILTHINTIRLYKYLYNIFISILFNSVNYKHTYNNNTVIKYSKINTNNNKNNNKNKTENIIFINKTVIINLL